MTSTTTPETRPESRPDAVLVIGAQGQLGQSMQAVVAEFPDIEWVFADRGQLDLSDLSGIGRYISQLAPRVIVNCAAYTAVDKAESEQEQADLINHQAVEAMARAALALDACLIHVSTDYVFDGCHYKPYAEDHPTAPVNFYGESKLRGERAIQRSGVTSLILRTSWVYAEFGNNFVKTMLRLGADRDHLTVIDDQVGTPTYAPDLARVICILIRNKAWRDAETGPCTFLHFSNEGVCSWFDFATEIMQLAGLACEVRPISTENYPTPARRPHYSVMSKARIRQFSGMAIPHWKASLQVCLRTLKGSI
jgi:dTDP-4-dehydrorhamnose reductase